MTFGGCMSNESSEDSRKRQGRTREIKLMLSNKTGALLLSTGNKSEAARMLGIHEATVRTKLKRYGISMEESALN